MLQSDQSESRIPESCVLKKLLKLPHHRDMSISAILFYLNCCMYFFSYNFLKLSENKTMGNFTFA